MTVDEWRQLEERSHDVKHDYIDGQIYAMAGGSLAHSRVSINVLKALDAILGRGPCRAYNSDAAVRLSPTRYTYPDATVTCDERDRPTTKLREIQAPRIIVEVLSNSTEAYDRGEKFEYYRACPAVQEYVLVSTRRQLVEVFQRTQEGWTTYHVYGPGDEIELTSIDVHLSLAALYELTDVPEIVETPKGEV
jgi:Uma2 family endonuclease